LSLGADPEAVSQGLIRRENVSQAIGDPEMPADRGASRNYFIIVGRMGAPVLAEEWTEKKQQGDDGDHDQSPGVQGKVQRLFFAPHYGMVSIRERALVVLVVIGCAMMAACASTEYRYLPAEHLAPDGKGQAVYVEPPGMPSGKMRILSWGIVDIKPQDDQKTFPALHLRISISNQSKDQEWAVNAQDQSVSFPNQGQSRPIVAYSEKTSTSSLVVKPGELRWVDLYFPLPKGAESAKDLSQFDFHWQIYAGNQLIRDTTLFDRAEIPEYYYAAVQ
jgi:hypothetical protein